MPEYCIWGVAERIQQDPPFHIIIQTFSFMQRGTVGRGVTQLTFRSKQSFGIAVERVSSRASRHEARRAD